jgi:ABC-type nitrate/sulfonate/bicarbonate transport system permease component
VSARLPLIAPVAFAALVLGGWEAAVALSGVRESLLPAPSAVAEALWVERGLLGDAAWVTLREVLLGYALAVAAGVGLAIVIRASRIAEHALYPWLVASQMVPVPAIAPVLVLWLGFGMAPKVIVIALVSFFPIAVNTVDGLRAADPELLRLLRTLGASRRQRFRHARLPAALPFVFSGLKVAAALAVIGAVFAEWVGASEGLGHLILVLNNQTATPEMFAAIVVLALLGIALFGLVAVAERLVAPWYHEVRAPRIPG